jgi:hypothetical protein
MNDLFDLSNHSLSTENARALDKAIRERLDAGYPASDPGIRLLQRALAEELA